MDEAHKDFQKLHKDSICEYLDDLSIEERSRDDVVFKFKLVEFRLFDSSHIQRNFFFTDQSDLDKMFFLINFFNSNNNLFVFSKIVVRLLRKV